MNIYQDGRNQWVSSISSIVSFKIILNVERVFFSMQSSRFLNHSSKRKISQNDHSLSLVLVHCHSLPLGVFLCSTRCHSVYYSISFVVIPCHSLLLVVPLVVTQCIAHLLFCKPSKNNGTCRKKLNTNYIDSSYLFAIQKSKSTCFQK